jgi:hypothetical protein
MEEHHLPGCLKYNTYRTFSDADEKAQDIPTGVQYPA